MPAFKRLDQRVGDDMHSTLLCVDADVANSMEEAFNGIAPSVALDDVANSLQQLGMPKTADELRYIAKEAFRREEG